VDGPRHGAAALWDKYDTSVDTRTIELRKRRNGIRTKRKDVKAEARERDGKRCRWPREDHDTPNKVCLGAIEASHQTAIGMGGEKVALSRTRTEALLTACHYIHQQSKDSLEKHGRSWEGLDPEKGADGPVRFMRRDPKTGEHVEFARERLIGVLETI
jgi:hypothetical protein